MNNKRLSIFAFLLIFGISNNLSAQFRTRAERLADARTQLDNALQQRGIAGDNLRNARASLNAQTISNAQADFIRADDRLSHCRRRIERLSRPQPIIPSLSLPRPVHRRN